MQLKMVECELLFIKQSTMDGGTNKLEDKKAFPHSLDIWEQNGMWPC